MHCFQNCKETRIIDRTISNANLECVFVKDKVYIRLIFNCKEPTE